MKSKGEESGRYETTWSHLTDKIHVLVISTNRYIVFIDKNGDVDWETTPWYDDTAAWDANYDLSRYNNALNSAALLEAVPCDGFSQRTRLSFKLLIAEGLGCALDHDYATAETMFQRAGEYIRLRGEELSRSWYLLASLLATVPFAAAGLLTIALRPWLQQAITVDGVWLVIASCAGAIGAMLSIIVRAGKINVDHAAGRRLHDLEGVSRILAGAICGLLAGLAVRSELFFGNLIHENKMNLAMTAIALTAGTSERLINSIISNVAPVRHEATSKPTNQKATRGAKGS